jgi:cobyrinic acid a,c-diamide synthase
MTLRKKGCPNMEDCKQSAKVTTLLWLMPIILVLVGIASTASAAAASKSSEALERIALQGEALKRVDGSDRDIAVIKQRLDSIDEALKDIKQSLRKP